MLRDNNRELTLEERIRVDILGAGLSAEKISDQLKLSLSIVEICVVAL